MKTETPNEVISRVTGVPLREVERALRKDSPKAAEYAITTDGDADGEALYDQLAELLGIERVEPDVAERERDLAAEAMRRHVDAAFAGVDRQLAEKRQRADAEADALYPTWASWCGVAS